MVKKKIQWVRLDDHTTETRPFPTPTIPDNTWKYENTDHRA